MATAGEIPSSEAFAKALAIEVLDGKGQSHTFESLLDTAPRVVVIFIRHFYCGSCQDYIKLVSRVLKPEEMLPTISVLVIGCGSPAFVAEYAENTSCPWPIYAHPSAEIHHILGMIKTSAAGTPMQYTPRSWLSHFAKGMYDFFLGIPSGKAIKAGNPSQVGGEFVVDGRDGKKIVTWCHRMQNHRGHTEVPDLCKALGVPTSI